MILGFPDGYDFQVSAGGAALSGGQRQRIALARAFYGSPVVVVMDEPDSNLDAEGTMALARAVEDHKKRGGSAVIVAHRHGAFAQCDTVYLMEAGRPVSATSGRGAAPVRSLKSSEGTKGTGRALPSPGSSVTSGRAPGTAGAGAAPTGPPKPAVVEVAARPGARAERSDVPPRPVVRIVRGGRKSMAAEQAGNPQSRDSEPREERARARPGAGSGAPDRDFARERRQRVAAAIVRVSNARASAGGGRGAAPNGSAGGPGPGPRASRDDAS